MKIQTQWRQHVEAWRECEAQLLVRHSSFKG